MLTAQDQFYSSLPIHRMSLGELLIRPELFQYVPRDWHVIITDIKGSTTAVLNGGHENVNLIATGSIVSVLNIAFEQQLTVPFFFGGDGATFIVPPSIIEKVMRSLAVYRRNTLENFNLELRTGLVPVEDVYQKGHELLIAKFSSSASFAIPIVLGNGLNYAEQLIKGADALLAEEPVDESALDLTGMQCRWDKIAPPREQDEVVTLLVIAGDQAHQSAVFAKVVNKIDELYGAPQYRQPISVAKLKLKTTFHDLSLEMKAKLGKVRWLELIQNWLVNLYGFIYFRTESGKTYLNSLVEMSDTLVIDGKINTVISGGKEQRTALLRYLDELEVRSELKYGYFVSGASVMSCYVRDLKEGHVHFVDGAEGGYTQAARMLKFKLN
jgi:hypothetical protein